jgi:hypothetical protein
LFVSWQPDVCIIQFNRNAMIKSLLTISLVLVAAACSIHAQPTPAPDCNEGRIQPPKTDPRHSYMHCFEPWGVMQGVISKCIRDGETETFGMEVVALGDVNHDNLADFAATHRRCDTLPDTSSLSLFPIEVFIYHGVRGGLSDVGSGQRIGPREIFSETRILCTGDWDSDGHRDLLTMIHLHGDTTEQAGHGYHTARIAVFWGSLSGSYSIDDTTRLIAYSDLWINALRAVSADLDGDSVADLVIWGGGGLSQGTPITTAQVHFYRGHKGRRWGQDGTARTADLQWWTPPPFNFMQVTDQDCDGHSDIALINQRQSNIASDVAVLYGRAGRLPDTNDVEAVNLTNTDGHYTLFTDVTGDRVPEMVANSDSEVVRVFAGKPGQRLKAMYGTGNEPSPPFPGKPWLSVPLPKKVDPDDWFRSGEEQLYDLGDGNLDGIADVWTYTYGFFICYVTGHRFDYFIDAGMRWGHVTSATRLGDIDGSGVATFAVGYGGTPGGLAFYHMTDSIPPTADGVTLPHPQSFRCAQAADVPAVDDIPHVDNNGAPDVAAIAVDVRPNPARGELVVRWSSPSGVHGDAVVTLVDASGREALRLNVPHASSETTIATGALARGVYLVVVHIGEYSSATRVALQ